MMASHRKSFCESIKHEKGNDMKRLLLLAFAVTISLGLMQGEAMAKNNKKSDSFVAPVQEQAGGRGTAPSDERWQELTPAQRREMQERYQKFQELSPEEQQKLRRRYDRFKELSPEKQKQMMERHRRLQQLPPEQRQQLKREWQQIKDLPPEQRSERRQELHRRFFNDSDIIDNDNGRERGRGRGRQ
jgi:hypothetical protein